jgi:hypothetical protein
MEVKKAEPQSSFRNLRVDIDKQSDAAEDDKVQVCCHRSEAVPQVPSHRPVSDADCFAANEQAQTKSPPCATSLRVSSIFSALRDSKTCLPAVTTRCLPPMGPSSSTADPKVPPSGQLFLPADVSLAISPALPCKNVWGNPNMLIMMMKKKGGPTVSASLASRAEEAIGMFCHPLSFTRPRADSPDGCFLCMRAETLEREGQDSACTGSCAHSIANLALRPEVQTILAEVRCQKRCILHIHATIHVAQKCMNLRMALSVLICLVMIGSRSAQRE